MCSPFSNFEQQEISDDWLATAEPEQQVAAVVEWFQARFQDPAHETPYMSSEGGYIWVHGGPYDASEEIQERFGSVVPFEVLEAAAELALEGALAAVETARNLAYAGVISALETFLWETMAYWVDHDEQTVRSLIKEHPVFKDRKVPLGSIFEVHESLGVQVKTHMQRMTWHRWDEARSLIEHGLGVKAPSHDPFEAPTQKRHDVIHRSSHDVDGNPINITIEEVQALAGEVQRFATELHRLIDHAKMPPEERFEEDF